MPFHLAHDSVAVLFRGLRFEESFGVGHSAVRETDVHLLREILGDVACDVVVRVDLSDVYDEGFGEAAPIATELLLFHVSTSNEEMKVRVT